MACLSWSCMTYLNLFIFFTHSCLFPEVFSSETKTPKRIAMKLIRRQDLLDQPWPKLRSSPENHIEYLTKSSSARFVYLQETIGRELGIGGFKVDVKRTFVTSLFFVNFSVGQPPVKQLAIMDTGSSLLWIQCVPCRHCSKQLNPMLEPSMSSTFVPCLCSDPICHHAPKAGCGASNECIYKQLYISGAGSTGILAREKFIFETAGLGKVVAPNIIFGCGHRNGEHTDNEFTGVLGLGAKPTSLAVQLGSKFSYCIGDITDRDYTYHQLVLGEDVDGLGYSTPIETSTGLYYVNLEGISIGEKRLNVDPRAFRRRGPNTGVIIDSGTLLTWLADTAYKELRQEIKTILDPYLERYWYKDYLCYNGKVKTDLVGFPLLTFHFAGGADLVLEAGSAFYQMSEEGDASWDVFCTAVRPTNEHGTKFNNFTAIGLMAQQYYNMAYDLKGRRLYLQRMDCVLLDDYSPS